MSARAPIDSPLTSQQKSDAQISNPASAITPTAPLEPTAPVDPLKTANPDNAGITSASQPKSGGFDINAINRGLSAAGMGTSPGWLADAYGITWNGVAQEEATKLPQFINDPDGNTYERKVVKSTFEWDKSKQQKFLQDMQGVDVQKKQPNSGVGIHPDIGGSLSETGDLADGFMQSPQILNNKALVADGSVAKFTDAYKVFTDAITQAQKLPIEQRADFIAGATWDLKIAMLPILDKAKDIIYKQAWGRTSQYDRLNDFSKQLESYAKLYNSSADDINNTIKAYQDQSNKYAVSFQKLDYKQKSENAKTRLKSNPAYVGFMELMMEANPNHKGMIQAMMNRPTVDEQEKEFLLDKFIGGSFKELFDQRAQAMNDFGPQAAAWFKDFDQILNVKKEIYKERSDDVLENMTAPIVDYNRLNFSVNTWY